MIIFNHRPTEDIKSIIRGRVSSRFPVLRTLELGPPLWLAAADEFRTVRCVSFGSGVCAGPAKLALGIMDSWLLTVLSFEASIFTDVIPGLDQAHDNVDRRGRSGSLSAPFLISGV